MPPRRETPLKEGRTMSDLRKETQAQRDYLVALRRELHSHPETGLQEYRTADAIERELTRWGISHSRVGATGVLGIIRGAGAGDKTVALRADIDALPIQETNQVEYRSQVDGVMHACGHDAHTASLLGAAKVLQENRDLFGGEIRLVFQSAEEIGKGAEDFVAAGVLKGVGRVFGLHTAADLTVGTVGVTAGLNNAAVDHFRILVHGKAAHVSTPQLGADALYIASHIVVALQALVTRRTSPVEPVIIGVGKLTAGTTYNAVAQDAELEGTTRTISQGTRERVRREITQTVEQLSALYGGTGEVLWTDVTPALSNDPQVSKEVAAVAEELFGAGHVVTNRPLSLGGDNFAEFLNEVPGVYAYLGTANPSLPGTLHPAHNGYFDIDEDALALGAGLYAEYALWYLTKGETG